MTVMFKPLLPIVNDWFSHEFNEADHLTLVHAVYGSHHLQKEISEASSDNEHGKSKKNLKFEEQFPTHVLTKKYNFKFSFYNVDIKYLAFLINRLSFVLIANPGPPPKF